MHIRSQLTAAPMGRTKRAEYQHVPIPTREAAVREAANGGRSVEAVARRHGVPATSLRRWLKASAAGAPLQPRPRGRRNLLGEEARARVLERVKVYREAGARLDCRDIVSFAAVEFALDHGMDVDNVYISRGWAQRFAAAAELSWRKCTTSTKAQLVPNKCETMETFHKEFHTHLMTHSIPADLVVNFDEMGIGLAPASEYTMEFTGAKQVRMMSFDDRREITAVLATALSGCIVDSDQEEK